MDRLDAAEPALRKAMALDPADPAPVISLASVLNRLGRREEARELSRLAAELSRARRSAKPGEIRYETAGGSRP
jgi:Flp pilus assembly protein TadD